MKLPLYLDNQATTPLDKRVLEAMLPWLTEHYGNPASNHAFGWVANEAVEVARAKVASAINCAPAEIVFTSGATESDNLALKGVAYSLRSQGNHIVTAATEHHAVLDACSHLEKQGFRITRLSVLSDGLIDLDEFRAALDDSTILASIMIANNEIGVIQPIADIAEICNQRGILFHTDAAQAFGKMPIDMDQLKIDLASITAHKIYGPKGIAALYVRKKRPRIKLDPIIDGGGQENGIRSGTLNVPGIVGFGAAAEIACDCMHEEAMRLGQLRDSLMTQVLAQLDRTRLNGHATKRLPGNLNLAFEGVEGESLLIGLSDIAISTGAACSSALREPSHVLSAIGLSDDEAFASVRFGLGRFTTQEEVDYTAQKVVEVVLRLRSLLVPPPVRV